MASEAFWVEFIKLQLVLSLATFASLLFSPACFLCVLPSSSSIKVHSTLNLSCHRWHIKQLDLCFKTAHHPHSCCKPGKSSTQVTCSTLHFKDGVCLLFPPFCSLLALLYMLNCTESVDARCDESKCHVEKDWTLTWIWWSACEDAAGEGGVRMWVLSWRPCDECSGWGWYAQFKEQMEAERWQQKQQRTKLCIWAMIFDRHIQDSDCDHAACKNRQPAVLSDTCPHRSFGCQFFVTLSASVRINCFLKFHMIRLL